MYRGLVSFPKNFQKDLSPLDSKERLPLTSIQNFTYKSFTCRKRFFILSITFREWGREVSVELEERAQGGAPHTPARVMGRGL